MLTEAGLTTVTSVSRRPPAADRRVDGVRYHLADVREAEGMLALLGTERPGLVIHLAGQRVPALAETQVAETLSSNVFGTQAVLAAAAAAGVPRVVTASTGKALRFFASEVYAASKKLGEYLVATAQERWGISCSTARFTHVVDNSVIFQKLWTWAQADEPVRLHAPGIAFYAQSALEAAQLLVAVSHAASSPSVAALTDIGWPHEVVDLALDIIDEERSSSAIHFSGYEPGYESEIFPGTYEPLHNEHSPLFNVLETRRLRDAPSGPVESVELVPTACTELDAALVELESALGRGAPATQLRELMNRASVALLVKTFADAPGDQLHRLRLAVQDEDDLVPEHRLVRRYLLEATGTKAQPGLVRSRSVSTPAVKVSADSSQPAG
jgi:nucleoside-diphosphate-sugar epimerase